jgi:hypothetical protein
MKTYNFVTSLAIEAESEDEANEKLAKHLGSKEANDLLYTHSWSLDPVDEDE